MKNYRRKFPCSTFNVSSPPRLAHFVKPAPALPKSKKKVQVLSNYAPSICTWSKNVTNPAISVIIPMYNAEKYIGECLESLLAQTFYDFEVILVDDCSTDSSCEIVENYMPKFEGRLKLHHTPKNTGSGVVARNIGLNHSIGEYIYNMDNDDVITQTGLEEMYTLAKEYDADVVYCEKYFMSSGVGEKFIKNVYLAEKKIQRPPFVDKPTLETQDLSERVQKILDKRFWVAPWLKLVRHDLLDKHKIFFPVLKISDDDIWTYALIFFAKKFLRVPNMIYIRRMRDDSISGIKKTPQQTISFWLNPVLFGMKVLDNFMDKIEFFQRNPQQRYAILEEFFKGKVHLSFSFKNTEQFSQSDIYDIVKEEFGKYLGEYSVTFSTLCAHIYNQSLALVNAQKNKERLVELEGKLNRLNDKKFDFMPTTSFQQVIIPAPLSPAISVVIPMYNAAEHVGECLESLLIQTFQDFEVILVDDCSIDNSIEIVESYAPKFNGRLKLMKLEKNSRTGGYVPRNTGFYIASGEYVYFLDADDFLLGSALETFYNCAKEYDADIVYMALHYEMNRPNTIKVVTDGRGMELIKKGLEDNPTLTIDDPDANLQLLFFEKGFTTPWVHFVRRDFLIKNKLVFPEIPKAGDYIWVIHSYCYAQRFLRITTPLYFYRRYGTNSVSKSTASNQFFNWISSFVIFAKTLTYIANKTKILKQNPAYCYQALKKFFDWCINRTNDARKSWSSQNIYKTLYNEFIKEDDLFEMTIPFLFSAIDNERKTKSRASESLIRKFSPYITARVDVKLVLQGEGDFQIVSVSDGKATVKKAGWLPENEIGYFIQSYKGNMEIVAKATANGQFLLNLKGMDIRNPEDKSKRVPYWIDYTKLTVNDKVIFDTPKSTWHDKPYRYTSEVKADDEIRIKTYWLPHQKETPAPLDVIKEVEPINKKFLPYLTARVDVKLVPQGEGDFQIVSVSDAKATVLKPDWFQKGGIGYQIQSYKGNMEIVAKATVDGQINLRLMGLYMSNPEDKSKCVPYWIDYTKLTVNDKVIFEELTPVWHDKPYHYTLEVKADDEIRIKTYWLPHQKETPAPLDVIKEVEPINKKFLPYLTARVDVKLVPQGEGDFQIVSVSDAKATVLKPDWFQKGGIGYQIQSYKGNMEIVAKATVDGQINLRLMGLYMSNPEDKSKRVPYWIDYTKLTVNDKVIFEKLTPVWHDKPYHYTLEVKAGDEIRIQTYWLPHRSDV